MKKRTYFDTHDGEGWPDPAWLRPYFLTEAGRRRFFAGGNDSWGLKAYGLEDTEHLRPFQDRIDVDLTILGHPQHGVLLYYDKSGGGQSAAFYSKGDPDRLLEHVRTVHGDLMPTGLYIPFEKAWQAVEEFIVTDGSLPECIDWIAGRDLPAGAIPPL